MTFDSTSALRRRVVVGFALSVVTAARADLLNEISVNQPGTDNPWEYIELRGTPGAALTNLYFVAFEGDGAGAGAADMVVGLNAFSYGASGLLVVKSPSGGHSIPGDTTVVTDPQLDTSGGGIENGTNSFFLIRSATPIVENTDYDTNNDGVLELPGGASVVDAIGWTDGGSGDIIYGGVALTQTSGTPDAATRFPNNVSPLSFDAWFNGDLTGNPDTLLYDPNERSANFPPGGMLTPGAANVPEPATLALVATGLALVRRRR